MKKNLLRFVASLPGVVMGLNGLVWLVQPEEAAADLGMPLLDGIGRSTQIGDFGAFFLGISILVFAGVIRFRGDFLYNAALFLGGAAVVRVFSFFVHDAGLATELIIAEAVMMMWLIVCGILMDRTHQA